MVLKKFKTCLNAEYKDYLGAKIRSERLSRKLTQKELAELAGIPLRTYKRFEQNCDGSFDNFVNILRAFDKLRFLHSIFPATNIKHKKTIIEKFEEIRNKSLSRD